MSLSVIVVIAGVLHPLHLQKQSTILVFLNNILRNEFFSRRFDASEATWSGFRKHTFFVCMPKADASASLFSRYKVCYIVAVGW